MYFGDHSIRFYPDESYVGEYLFDSEKKLDICPDTWKTWKLIPNEKPIFASPEFDDELLQIPGRHGLVRLTKGGIGHTVYGNIKGSIDFTPDPDEITHWSGLYSDIRRYLHGKERLAVLRDDRYFFYKGLFRVKDIAPDKYYDKISIEYSLEPFKYERWDGEHDWYWDDFDFGCGIIRNARTLDENPYMFTVDANKSHSFELLYRDFRTPLLAKVTIPLKTGSTNVELSSNGKVCKIEELGVWTKTLYYPETDRDNYKRTKSSETVTVANRSGEKVVVQLRFRGCEL